MKKKKQYKNLDDERYGIFMNDTSFNLDVMYGRNYLKTDNIQKVKIYKPNIIETKTHDLYGQTKAKDKKFFNAVEINVMINIESATQNYYGDNEGGIVREDTGPLEFGVYLDELEEKNLEISRGDYVEYNLSGEKNRYYEIEFSNTVNDTSDKTIGGFKNYWLKIKAVPVKEDTIPFLNETN